MATLIAVQISLPNTAFSKAQFPKAYPTQTVKLQQGNKPRQLSVATAVSKADGTAVSPSLGQGFEADADEGELAKRWKEMVGENHWDGLLKPMDERLRRELIKYGEMAAATYTAFIKDTYARNYGVCQFQVWDFFDHLLMPAEQGYDVTKLIYATTKDEWWPPFMERPANPRTWQQSNIFMGYIAVSNDETTRKLGRRDVCIAWRGTQTALEWGSDFQASLKRMPAHEEYLPNPDQKVKIESGFLSLYTHKDEGYASSRELVLSELKRLINRVYPDEEVSITTTGHSLGAALALLNGYDIMETKSHIRENGDVVKVCAITYAGPRVGNIYFKDRVKELGLKVLRIVNVHDPVPKVPGAVVNERFFPDWVLRLLQWYPWGYAHTGVLLQLNHHDSPYLKKIVLSEAHDLEGYIHLIDGYPTKGQNFQLATERDIALVNRYSDYLLKSYEIPPPKSYEIPPPTWNVKENKDMVKSKDGRWVHRSVLEDFNQEA